MQQEASLSGMGWFKQGSADRETEYWLKGKTWNRYGLDINGLVD